MSAPKYPNIVRAFSAQAWAMQPEKLAALIEVIQSRVAGGVIPADVIAAHRDAAAQRRAATPAGGGAVAVIPIYGSISQRLSMMSDMSGGASTEQIGAQFDAAMANPAVGAIVLDIDSPGGSVSGVPELAAKIRGARGQGKQILAVANSLMASAAYWIGCAADEIIATPSADVGSIGVYQAHLDASQALADEGLKYTLISAGEYKVEGNPYEPLSAEAEAAMQAAVDEWYGAFTSDVAKSRGVGVADVRKGYGEGRVLTAKSALAAGMVERIATLDDVLAELTGGKGAKSTRRAADANHVGVAAHVDLSSVTLSLLPSMSTTTAPSLPLHVPLVKLTPLMPLATADEAAVVLPSPTLETAPQARSHTVNDTPTAAERAVGEPTVSRETQIIQLATIAGKDLAWAQTQIVSGATLKQVQEQLAAERSIGTVAAAASGIARVGADREADRAFESPGEQLVAIIQAGKPGGRRDRRLDRINATVTGMNESVGSEGGFFIEPQFLPEVTKPVFENDPIVSRVKKIPLAAGKNAIKYNVIDETSRATGSRQGGVQMYWVAEGGTAADKKPKLRQMVLEKKKIMGISYLTEELTEDAPAAQVLVMDAFEEELGFMLGDAIIRGPGVGSPLGILNSGATVSVAIEATQTIANTAGFLSYNVAKMLSRVPASLWSRSVFLYNPELLPYLINATNGASGTVPLFMQVGGLSAAPQGSLLGVSAYASDLCEAVGTPGDLMLIVPSEYHMIGAESAKWSESIHVRFLYDELTLKITTRTDGAPVWRTSVTPYKGSNARSPFVTLALRT